MPPRTAITGSAKPNRSALHSVCKGLFVDLFLDAHSAAPPQLTLDLDATDDALLRRAAWCT